MGGDRSIVGVMLRRVLSRLVGSGNAKPVNPAGANVDGIPDHESAVRRMVSDTKGGAYEALESLDEARARADTAIVMEGDYGGLHLSNMSGTIGLLRRADAPATTSRPRCPRLERP